MKEIGKWIERKCKEKSCMNLSIRGSIYCENHLHVTKLPDEVIGYLKRRTSYFSMQTRNDKIIEEVVWGDGEIVWIVAQNIHGYRNA